MNENLKTSQTGLALISKWEGCSLKLYTCPAGKPTIGYGHVVLPTENIQSPITQAQALALLAKDVERFERAIHRLITVPLNQNQFDALVCFIFNTGEGGITNSGVSRAINAGQFDKVPEALMAWSNARVDGVMKPILATRRKSEGELFMRTGAAPVYWSKDSLAAAQTKLAKLGLYSIKVDGFWGPTTEKAILAFAQKSGVGAGSNPSEGVPQAYLDALASA